jgi:hypothetical protein
MLQLLERVRRSISTPIPSDAATRVMESFCPHVRQMRGSLRLLTAVSE